MQHCRIEEHKETVLDVTLGVQPEAAKYLRLPLILINVFALQGPKSGSTSKTSIFFCHTDSVRPKRKT